MPRLQYQQSYQQSLIVQWTAHNLTFKNKSASVKLKGTLHLTDVLRIRYQPEGQTRSYCGIWPFSPTSDKAYFLFRPFSQILLYINVHLFPSHTPLRNRLQRLHISSTTYFILLFCSDAIFFSFQFYFQILCCQLKRFSLQPIGKYGQ